MRVVIDLQGFQASNRERGIGRYSLSLALAMAKNRGRHEILIALNGLFPDSVDEVRRALYGVLPLNNIRVWHAVGPVAELDESADGRRHVAQAVREVFLASLNPDVVLVSSLFEGFGDDAVTSIGQHVDLPTAVVLYDLIPLIYPDDYLSSHAMGRWYNGKIDQLVHVDRVLSISASAGREAQDRLNIDNSRVVNISAASEDNFAPQALTEGDWQNLRTRYSITHDYVMYTGGIDPRKNIEGLIEAYGALPNELRAKFQLVIVCSLSSSDHKRLSRVAVDAGLQVGELLLTGFVPQADLITLYNGCTLFVFPSFHEGFGLPVLEAMQCGRPVLASDSSSLTEVLDCREALFDPRDQSSIATKLESALSDADFRERLACYGLAQSRQFSWERTAKRAIEALVELAEDATAELRVPQVGRPRLAYVSPLPPERTGIGDYSAELLPWLAEWYEIDVVVDQPSVADDWVNNHCGIRSVGWFLTHHDRYDRVLYHFGNSHFHQHMFELVDAVPGTVVLHDFYLSGILAHMELVDSNDAGALSRALYASHGYAALAARTAANDIDQVIRTYPCNLAVLNAAQGVIVHSDHARDLAVETYGPGADVDFALIPHMRQPVTANDRDRARSNLGLSSDAFVVCSFGLLGPAKLNHRLLETFLESQLAADRQVVLVFVGEIAQTDYGARLKAKIRGSGIGRQIHITGWADKATFRNYLAAADIGVQLRAHSYGETSGTLLDCLNHGLATIVNDTGSMREIGADAVWLLSEQFDNQELIEALETLWRDPSQRKALGHLGRRLIKNRHDPSQCAENYRAAIEAFHEKDARRMGAVAPVLAVNDAADAAALRAHSNSLAKNFPPRPRKRQLLVDVSELVQRDVGTGVQRVTRAILKQWLRNPPYGWTIEPVYATEESFGYYYARHFACDFLGVPWAPLPDEPLDAWLGDVFIGLDLQPSIVPAQQPTLDELRRRGVLIYFVVYDLLPVLMPECFIGDAADLFERWLACVSRYTGAFCISRTVAAELKHWLYRTGDELLEFDIGWFRLGSDAPKGPENLVWNKIPSKVRAALDRRITFLMVGTLEPRKGHDQVLDAFELLWHNGCDVNLVVIGKQGWLVERLVERIRNHEENSYHLFWIDHVSDSELAFLYARSSCLIAASFGEGFGLPLIEAAQRGVPLIARDIPVFREVAGQHAYYFSGATGSDLATTIKAWLEARNRGSIPTPDGVEVQSWRDSAEQLFDAISARVGAWPSNRNQDQVWISN